MPEPARPLAAVLGRPIAHSLSPLLHRAAYAALELDWSYTAIDCGEADLPRVLADHPGAAGFSCTMPLKRAVLDVAAQVSDQARAIGAGNTLLPGPDGWRADNTDWIGIRDSLAAHRVDPSGRVLILGAGGTAQAALAALAAWSGGQITGAVRAPERAAELRATADRLNLDLTVIRLERAMSLRPDLIVSTLPAGVADHLELPTPAALLDVVYQGWPTALARRGAERGVRLISGASMLLFQAAAQVELMTGRAAPVEAMRAAMLAAVPGCGA